VNVRTASLLRELSTAPARVAELVAPFIDAVVERIDLELLVDRLPIEKLVDRLPIEQIIERVDINALLARIDMDVLAQRVIEAVDIPAIVRSSTRSMVGDGADAVRAQTAALDEGAARSFDRILRRRGPRDVAMGSA
jgi:hypothetical protein